MSQDHPGVRFPPPFIYVGFIILGLTLQRVWPIAVVPQGLAAPFGIAFVVVGFAIAFAGFRELTRHKTTIRPDQPSSRIVRSGPYRFTRKPALRFTEHAPPGRRSVDEQSLGGFAARSGDPGHDAAGHCARGGVSETRVR